MSEDTADPLSQGGEEAIAHERDSSLEKSEKIFSPPPSHALISNCNPVSVASFPSQPQSLIGNTYLEANMKNLQLLDETIRNLEQETNLTRIKKLMLCVCQGRWENNADLLAALNLRDLIIEVCEVTGSLDNLKFSLDGIVSNINKPQQYALVAQILISNLGKFYDDGLTQPGLSEFPTPPDLANTLVIVSDFTNETDFDLPTPPEALGAITGEKIFDLRLKVVQHTSPLRAKILIFSALDRLFEFNRDEDWLNLKKIQLDELLQQIYELCPSVEALESHLYETAKNLPEADENYQSAGVIVQYMRPLYSPIGKLPPLPDSLSPGSDRWNALPEIEGADEDSSASHGFIPDDDDNDYSEIREESEDGSDILSEVLPPISLNFESLNRSDRKFSLNALKKIDPVQQKQELEKKLTLKVNQSVEEIVQFIENRLNHLEREISDELEPLDIEDGISVKYETMGDFITQVKQATSQFLELLINLEEAERNQPIEREDNSTS
ncbi:hypothetical protein [Laspinema olomoucense]|uniref:Uncharacterized protein n=1 Tax=Laspinema olomoucense D3b TaxID=2953688 RepID=A0ABT2N552_9CYAN|nr:MULTISPECIES: hypothetical protein [unclassified Laspinema]MCT7972026.1 hypothetical protein [Laspinema sp. D3d]MCT7976505.1 hypothetical protein [Laspinema sp. D3b]